MKIRSSVVKNAMAKKSLELADQYAKRGSVKHFALRLGFMPHDEEDAEAILRNCVKNMEILEEGRRCYESIIGNFVRGEADHAPSNSTHRTTQIGGNTRLDTGDGKR